MPWSHEATWQAIERTVLPGYASDYFLNPFFKITMIICKNSIKMRHCYYSRAWEDRTHQGSDWLVKTYIPFRECSSCKYYCSILYIRQYVAIEIIFPLSDRRKR